MKHLLVRIAIAVGVLSVLTIPALLAQRAFGMSMIGAFLVVDLLLVAVAWVILTVCRFIKTLIDYVLVGDNAIDRASRIGMIVGITLAALGPASLVAALVPSLRIKDCPLIFNAIILDLAFLVLFALGYLLVELVVAVINWIRYGYWDFDL